MSENRNDRRAAMSRTMMRKALVRLLAERPMDSVSVTMICREADVNRSTFYRNYNSTADLLNDICTRVSENIYRAAASAPPSRVRLRRMLANVFAYLERERETVLILMSGNSGVDMLDMFTDITMEFLPPDKREGIGAHVVRFVCAGTLATIGEWLRDPKRGSPEDAAGTIYTLLRHGIGFVVPGI